MSPPAQTSLSQSVKNEESVISSLQPAGVTSACIPTSRSQGPFPKHSTHSLDGGMSDCSGNWVSGSRNVSTGMLGSKAVAKKVSGNSARAQTGGEAVDIPAVVDTVIGEGQSNSQAAILPAPPHAGNPTAIRMKTEKECFLKEDEERCKAPTVSSYSRLLSHTTQLPSPPLPLDHHELKRPICGSVQLSEASRFGLCHSFASALATARTIDNLENVQYPDPVAGPKPSLNVNAQNGKFRYDREFLLQFMKVCEGKPDRLPSWHVALGLEPKEKSTSLMHCSHVNSGSQINNLGPSSVPLGIPAAGNTGVDINSDVTPVFPVGYFGTGGDKTVSEQGFDTSRIARYPSASGPPGSLTSPSCPRPMFCTGSRQDSRRPDLDKFDVLAMRECDSEGNGSSDGAYDEIMDGSLKHVEPLKATENRWLRRPPEQDLEAPEVVERKVKALLNKLTMEKFDLISDQIISWANQSEKEKDGRTLFQVVRLVYENATNGNRWARMYARLCRKMMEQISKGVQDDSLRNREGKPISGSQLFLKYLLNRCQKDFERAWSIEVPPAKSAETGAASSGSKREAADQVDTAYSDRDKEPEAIHSDKLYIAQRAKRQRLALVKFISELFNFQMLTEGIIHKCVKRLLDNVEHSEGKDVESLFELLLTIGQRIDKPRGRSHMERHFARMTEFAKGLNSMTRMKHLLLETIELRERNWSPRIVQGAPTTIVAVQGSSDRQLHLGSSFSSQATRIARTRPHPGTTDLTQFGKIGITFGPRSVFAKQEAKGREASLFQTNSALNMFAMPNSVAVAEQPTLDKSSHPSNREGSSDFTQNELPEAPRCEAPPSLS